MHLGRSLSRPPKNLRSSRILIVNSNVPCTALPPVQIGYTSYLTCTGLPLELREKQTVWPLLWKLIIILV
jgi:hypothetical protein